MKLVRLELKHFASVWAGMNKKEIVIDFTKCKYPITLITGKNGSGKTSLLAQLNPFPNLVATDIRATENLILEGKEGHKLFICEENGVEYRAEHWYKPKKDGGHTTSCSFKKNGKELNPTSTVRSFYDVVNLEFGLDPSFLKIIRLGPNMTDIIAMKSTERKEFISTFLSEVTIYNALFKIAKEESNFVKTNLKIVVSQYDQIAGFEDLKTQVHIAEANLDRLGEQKSKLEIQLHDLDVRMQQEVISDAMSIQYEDAYKKHLPTFRLLSSITAGASASELRTRYKDLTLTVERMKTEQLHLTTKINETADALAGYMDKIADLQNKISLIHVRDASEDLTDLIIRNQSQIKELKKEQKYIPKLHPGNYLQALNHWMKIEEYIHSFYEYGSGVVYRIRDLSSGKKIDSVIPEIDKELDKQMRKLSEKIGAAKAATSSNEALPILYIPASCPKPDACPMAQYYWKIKETKKEKGVKALQRTFDELENCKKAMDLVSLMVSSMDTIETLLGDTKSEFLVTKNTILLTVLNYKPDDGYRIQQWLHDRIAQAELVLQIEACEKELTALKLEKATLDANGGLGFLEASLQEAEQAKQQQEELLTSLQKKAKQLEEDLFKKQAEEQQESQTISILDEYEDNRAYFDSVKRNWEAAQKSNEIKYAIAEEMHNLQFQRKNLEKEISAEKRAMKDAEFQFTKKQELQKQKEALEDRYEWVELIRESLSSTKGIPLIFIQLYLKNIQIMANEIIHVMFDDKITLLNFNITEKEFTMPYITNGIEVRDVSYASQGERTTIVMALSFAILQQFISKYNILLLDEMDGPLYKSNKKKFIGLVEHQMERIGAEQAVLITHNDLFENYPVDLIVTSEIETGYNKANVIWTV